MKLMAMGDAVVLKIRPKVTNSVIELPDQAKEADDFCEVVSIGPAVTISLSEGGLVLRPTGLYEWHDEENDETYLVVRQEDVVALGVDDGR